MKAALALLLVLLGVQPLYAESDSSAAVPFMEFFESTSRELDIPVSVVLAIARVESEIKPWTLNVEGQSFRFTSKSEALEKAMEARRDGLSFDVGIMQINSWWLDRYDIPPEAAFDPLANIYLGCWIFKQELVRHKDLRTAIGAYHSPNPLRASRYADQVMKALARGPVNNVSGQPQKTASAARGTKSKPVIAVAPVAASRLLTIEPATFKVGFNLEQSMKVRKK